MRDRKQVIGIALVVLGLLFLLGRGLDFGAMAWPFFVLIPGVIMLAVAFLGDRSSAALAIPGSIVTTIGLILFVLNLTDYWQAWAYCWALVAVGAGLGNFIHGALTRDPQKERDGLRAAYVGLILFAAFGAFFEFFIWGGASLVMRWLIPLALIAVGVYLILRREQPTS